MDKEAVKKWFSDRDNQLLFCLMTFTVVYRLFYFFKLGQQPIWWDEADYLGIAKVWALNQVKPEWWVHFTGMRPLLIPIIWAILFKIGLTEIVLRFLTLLLPSILSVYLVYALGRDMYSKKAGLIAGSMMSVYWVFTFYSYRLLTDIPATFLGLASLYFFWSVYLKKNKNYGLYLSVALGILAFSARFPLALVLISIALYLLVTRKFAILTDKTMWKAAGIGVIFFIPYLAYFIYSKFALFNFYFGEKAVTVHQAMDWGIIPRLFTFIDPATQVANQPFYMHIWAIAVIIGLLSLYKLFLGLDLVFFQKDKKYNSDFFLVLFLIVHLVFYIMIFRGGNDRWLLMLIPPIFILCGNGLLSFYNFLKEYSKEIAILLVLVILFGGFYQNFTHANALIENKKTSYNEVKLAGEWIKENSLENAKVVTASVVQNQYYSERQSYNIGAKNDTPLKDCWNLMGQLLENETCQKLSEQGFNEKVADIKPDYFIISVFEPYFTPTWAYSYAERSKFERVMGYSDEQGQGLLLIYKFNNTKL